MIRSIALALALLIGAGYLFISSWLAGPDNSGEFKGPVTHPVEIRYDEHARPFVSAATFEDAFFAQGWLHARDRLWQMETFRRAATGRLAELLGKPGLSTDIAIWRSGVPELGSRMEKVASEQLMNYIEAYILGINTWLLEGNFLPPELTLLDAEPKPWQPSDVFAMAALMAYQSANNMENELMRLALIERLGDKAHVFIPDETPLPNPIQISATSILSTLENYDLTLARRNPLFAAPSLGSNSWAIARPSLPSLFAFDSHDGLALPNLTYDVHLFVGSQQIRGNSVPGLLGVINGYNEFMAWGFTNIGDSQDLFLETRDTEDHNRFKGRAGWYSATKQIVEIPVRDSSPYVLELVKTENGRLIQDEPPIAVRWAPLEDHSYGLDALLKLNRATSLDAFHSALDTFVAPSANATYADKTGVVLQRALGLLPNRGSGAGLVPLRADDLDSGWRNMLPLDGLPMVEGHTVAAANRPITTTPPLISADNAPGYRVARIEAVLATNAHTVKDTQALQTDATNLQALRLLPTMLSRVNEDGAEIDTLKVWLDQGAIEAVDSQGALIFALWYQHLVEVLFREPLGDDLYARLLRLSYLINEAIDNQLLGRKDPSWPISEALTESLERAIVEYNAIDPSRRYWGHQHHLTLKHEMSGAFPFSEALFDRGPYPMWGGNTTTGRARYSYSRPFAVTGGATTRTVLKMSDPIEAWMIMPGGQSGWPGSDHYNDQTAHWVDKTYSKIATSPDELGPADILILP